jgi:hypothetical protein
LARMRELLPSVAARLNAGVWSGAAEEELRRTCA